MPSGRSRPSTFGAGGFQGTSCLGGYPKVAPTVFHCISFEIWDFLLGLDAGIINAILWHVSRPAPPAPSPIPTQMDEAWHRFWWQLQEQNHFDPFLIHFWFIFDPFLIHFPQLHLQFEFCSPSLNDAHFLHEVRINSCFDEAHLDHDLVAEAGLSWPCLMKMSWRFVKTWVSSLSDGEVAWTSILNGQFEVSFISSNSAAFS